MTSRLELVTECEHGEESAHYICEGLSYTNAAAYMEMEHTDKKCLCPGGGSRVQVTITDELLAAAANAIASEVDGWSWNAINRLAKAALLAAFRQIGVTDE